MSNYYCLVAGMPDVAFDGSKSAYTVERFKEDIYSELSATDAACVDLFFLERDNANILNILRHGDDAVIGQYGCYSRKELEEIISSAKSGDTPSKNVPSYIYRFFDYYTAHEGNANIIWEDVLSAYYYDYATSCANTFVADWFTFNRNVNNILVAFAARKYKMNMSECIVGDDETSETIRNSASRDFGLAGTIDYLEQVLRLCESDKLQERERQMDELRWNWLEDNSIFNYFTIERIYVFLQKLDIVTRWTKLDTETGAKRYKELIDGLKSGLTINDEDYQ